MAAASGKPVDRILPTFVNQPGVPLVEVSLSCVPTTGRSCDVSQQRFSLDPARVRTARQSAGRFRSA